VLSDISVIDLFMAGILPGLLVIACQMVTVQWLAKKGRIPGYKSAGHQRKSRNILWRAIPVLILPVVIVGGIRSGVFTPIEGAAVALGYSVLLAGVLRQLKLGQLLDVSWHVARGMGEILLMIGAAGLLAWVLVAEQIPAAVTELMLGVSTSGAVLLVVINLLLLIIGMVIDNFAAMVILVPILMPVVQEAGIDPIHFGVIMNVNLMIGAITPPVGLCLFVTSRVAGVPFEHSIKEVVPFIVSSLCALGIITYVPSISLFIPNLFK